MKKDQKRLKPIILHQEKFYGDKTWKNIYNLWILLGIITKTILLNT